MKIRTISIPVLDQEKAFQFYTTKLGFLKKLDVPLGDGNRWLTLVSPEEPDAAELLLEPAPLHFEPSKVFQEELFKAGIPWTQFNVDDVDSEHKKLVEKGVEFKMEPTVMGTSKFAVFNDTCGNYIQIIEQL